MDEWQYEQAEARAQRERDEGIARSREAMESGPRPMWCDGEPFCAVCGDALPLARAEAGRGRCVECQSDVERLASMAGWPVC